MSFQNNLESFDKISSISNMIRTGISLLDILKPNIKSKQNDNVIKMLDIVKDEPDAYLELLSVAIIHSNFEIVKLIKEKYIKNEIGSLSLNSKIFYNSILPDDSKFKLNDLKNNYEDIICPLVLMAGIGGSIDIFKYLIDQDLIDLINDLKIIGTIGLSKKYRNAINSNIIGACAFYGNHILLDYLLKNYRLKVDINVIATEEKVQINKEKIIKEMEGASPPLLTCGGPCSDDKTFEILKILEEYKANFEDKDFNKNNILHIATRNKKIKTLKFLINSLELKDFINEKNNDNLTPADIAKEMENSEIISFFNNIGIKNDSEEQEEKELSPNDFNKNEENNKDKEYDCSNGYSNNKKYKRNYNDFYNKNYKNKDNYRNNYDYNNNYKSNYINNYANNNYYKKNKSRIYKTGSQRNFYDNNKNSQNYQRNKKRNNENNYSNRNYNYSDRNPNRYHKNDNSNMITEEEQNQNRIDEKKQNEIEEKENQEIKEEKEEKENNKLEEKKEEDEEIEEGSFSEEDFLNEKEEKTNINIEEENNSEKSIYYEYMELYNKYIDIKRKCYNIEKEKKEMYLYINKMNMNKKTNIYNIKNSEENINSLLNIANEELEAKNKYIKELKKDCIMTDLTNIKNFDKEKLNKYKEFYLNNIAIINNELKVHAK